MALRRRRPDLGLFIGAYHCHIVSMNNPMTAPDVFDRDLIKRRRARMKADHFLLARCADDAAERLLDVNRNFSNALILGNPQFARALIGQLPVDKIADMTSADFSAAPESGVIFADEESLPFEAEQFDLIISALGLHHVNDLPGALVQINRALKPDGLFIGAMFGGATLTQLRQSLYGAEDALYGGITPRVSPMADFQQAAGLLQRAGFALPVVDTDKVSVNYANPGRLFTDLKAMAETNALTARSRKPVSKRFLAKTAQIYSEQFSNADGKAVASFEILWLTGWAKHPDQQKPLRPGSAKTRLADALGVTETKL